MNRGLAADPRLPSIIAAVEGGRSMRATAKDFGVSQDAVERYFRKYGQKAPKVPEGVSTHYADPDTARSIYHRLSDQLASIERMAAQPGLSQRAYLDLVTQMRLLAAELAKQPPPAVEQPDLTESDEWIELRALWQDFNKTEDPTGGLESRWLEYMRMKEDSDEGE